MIKRQYLFAIIAAALFAAACVEAPSSDPSVSSASQALSSAPSLGAASSFAVLGASTVTCTNASSLTGDVGVSPGTAITGFYPDCTTSGTIHAGDTSADQAHADLAIAYEDLGAVACDQNLTGTDLGGLTLAPGVYCFDSSVGLTGDLTLDGGGDTNAVWIFQIASTLTTATDSSVIVAGGGVPCNVFWQIGSSATIGQGTAFQGNILAFESITLVSNTRLVGRALALNAAVTMDGNDVSLSECSVEPPMDAGMDAGLDAGTDAGTDGGTDDCDCCCCKYDGRGHGHKHDKHCKKDKHCKSGHGKHCKDKCDDKHCKDKCDDKHCKDKCKYEHDKHCKGKHDKYCKYDKYCKDKCEPKHDDCKGKHDKHCKPEHDDCKGKHCKPEHDDCKGKGKHGKDCDKPDHGKPCKKGHDKDCK